MKFRKIIKIVVLSLFFGLISPSFTNALDANDFYFDSMHVDYVLSKDKQGRSVLEVSETLEAVFPDFDQNHGIERFIPEQYDGHSLNLELNQVGVDEQFGGMIAGERSEDGFLKLRIGERDKYLRGKHVFKINYTLHDVILEPKDNKSIQEFYWDVNGIGWNQQFKKVSATIKMSPDLVKKLKNKQACYTGLKGSNKKDCLIKRTGDGYQVSTTLPVDRLENLTFAIAFEKETFVPYQKTWQDYALIAFKYLVPIGGVLVGMLGIRHRSKVNKHKVKEPYPAQYLPMKKSNLYFDAELIDSTKRVSAGLVDLAIRRKIDIVEKEKTGLFGSKKKQYQIELINTDNLSKNDIDFLNNFFKPLEVGAEYVFKDNDYKLGNKISTYNSQLSLKMDQDDYYQPDNKKSWYIFLGFTVTILAFFTGSALTLAVILINVVNLVVNMLPTLSEKGAEIKTHLLGLKKYIKMSETERLAFAQSVTTADRRALTGEDGKAKVVLYERLLPYAILFGLEKTWAKELEVLYQQNTDYNPSWYHGASALAASEMINSISSFSNTISSSALSSSSSSGSSGGGSSGGGGGGGGGGGW